jgi:anthranilate synthase component 1
VLNGEALVRDLPGRTDPLALYLHLTGGGVDTMLFERPSGPTLVLAAAAVRIECRGRNVTVSALGEEGGSVIDALAETLPHRLVKRSETGAGFVFPSVVSVDPSERLTSSSAFDILRAITAPGTEETGHEPFARAALGVIAFDHVDLLEDLPANETDPLSFPDLLFWVPQSLIVVESDGRARAVCTAFGDAGGAARRLDALAQACADVPPLAEPGAAAEPVFESVDLSDQAYADVVRAMKEHIRAGDVYQIVPSRTFHARCTDPLAAFAAQRRQDPSPYQFYVAAQDHILFGCSPETSVRVSDGMVEVKPIAGTRARGAGVDEDDRLETELRLDQKELAEHMMLVDLARNDVARVSEPGSRRVAKLLSVERYARVMHLVSSVTGVLRKGYDAVHALQAGLNVGTLSGAPKLRATEILRETERTKRGPYGGAVGWLNGAGDMDTGVVIRSAVVQDGVAYVRAGAGVVHDSDPDAEAEETKRKASALLSVLAGQRDR